MWIDCDYCQRFCLFFLNSIILNTNICTISVWTLVISTALKVVCVLLQVSIQLAHSDSVWEASAGDNDPISQDSLISETTEVAEVSRVHSRSKNTLCLVLVVTVEWISLPSGTPVPWNERGNSFSYSIPISLYHPFSLSLSFNSLCQ